jgi:hypothetical protein
MEFAEQWPGKQDEERAGLNEMSHARLLTQPSAVSQDLRLAATQLDPHSTIVQEPKCGIDLIGRRGGHEHVNATKHLLAVLDQRGRATCATSGCRKADHARLEAAPEAGREITSGGI